MSGKVQEFYSAMKDVFTSIFTDFGVLLLVVLAPILYGFLYPWPYSPQVADDIPVVIVDFDNSSLSRQVIRYAQATPELKVSMASSVDEAKDLFWKGDINGYLVIPAGFKRDVLYERNATVAVATNGSYALLNEGVSLGFAKALGTLSAGISIQELTSQGMSVEQAYVTTNPLSMQIQALYNPSQGYSSYVVPAVAVLILQQTLMIGVGIMIATWYEKKKAFTTKTAWLGRILAISIVGWVMFGYFYGWLFAFHDYTRGGNLWGLFWFGLIFIPTVAILGCLCGLVIKNRERVEQVLLFTSLPMYFLSGFSWPSEGMPEILQAARWILPSTAGIFTSILFNEMGAPISDAMYYLMNIAVIGIVAYLLLLKFGGGNKKVAQK